MSEPMLIPCPHCASLNRVPDARLADHPVCGRCKAPLFAGYLVLVYCWVIVFVVVLLWVFFV